MNPIPNEAHLVGLAQSGDNAAFNQLFDYYKPFVFQYAQQILGDADAAEDAVQNTLIYCWKKISSGEFVYQQGKLSHWMMATCKNFNHRVQEGRKLEDYLWYRLKREEKDDFTIYGDEIVSVLFRQEPELSDVDGIEYVAPKSLSPSSSPTPPKPPRKRYRNPKLQLEVYKLDQAGHTQKEISRMLGIPKHLVKQNLYLARKRIKENTNGKV